MMRFIPCLIVMIFMLSSLAYGISPPPLFTINEGTGGGSQIFVAPGGSGSACTDGSPCSLDTGIGQANAGDTVWLKDGTYNQDFDTVRSGSNGNHIFFKAVNSRQAVIRDNVGNLFHIHHSFITVSGIKLDDQQATQRGSAVLRVDKNCDCRNLVIEDMEIFRSGNSGISIRGELTANRNIIIRNNLIDGTAYNTGGEVPGEGIYIGVADQPLSVGVRNIIIRDNEVRDFGGNGIDFKHNVIGAWVFNNHFHQHVDWPAHGLPAGQSPRDGTILIQGGDTWVYNNVINDIHAGNGAAVFLVRPSSSSVANHVFNNVVFDVSNNGSLVRCRRGANGPLPRVFNNTFDDAQSHTIHTRDCTPVVVNNIGINGVANNLATNNFNDSYFLDTTGATRDYHLTAGAVNAIDAATNTPRSDVDFDGRGSVGARRDYGAYEFSTQAPPPPPPPPPPPVAERAPVPPGFGPLEETCVTTQQPGTSALVIVPDDEANLETAVETNTDTTVLIKAGDYSVTNFLVGQGNIVKPFDCQVVDIELSDDSDYQSRHDWTIAGLHFDCRNGGASIGNDACFRFAGTSNNWTFRNNDVYDADKAIYVIDNARTGVITGNMIEGCSSCDPSDLVRIGDTSVVGSCTVSPCQGGDSPSDIEFSANYVTSWRLGRTGVERGNDLLSINGVNAPGVVVRDNYFGRAEDYEQFIDLKNNQGKTNGVEIAYNTFIGPIEGQGDDAGSSGPGVIVGDIDDNNNRQSCRVLDDCPEHKIHHNYCQDCYAAEPSAGNNQQFSGGFWFGTARYSSATIEFNIDNNANRFSNQGSIGAVHAGIYRHNSHHMGSFRMRAGERVCSDTTGAGFTLTLQNNLFDLTELDDECAGTPDWDISDNVFSQIAGPGIPVGHQGTGNSNDSIVYARPRSFQHTDFTVTSGSHHQKGATPAPQITSAVVDDDCMLRITMQPYEGFGYSHAPMDAVVPNNITVKYDGVNQTINNGNVQINTLLLEMDACPAQGQTVTFDATHGWCRDSANVGGRFTPRGGIKGRCLAVTGQAVTNLVGPAPVSDTFHVNVACVTNGNGTSETCGANGPWNSIRNAIHDSNGACAGMVPGNTLSIKGGTYRETGNINPHPNCSGIIIENAANEAVIVDGTKDLSTLTWESRGNGVWECTSLGCGSAGDFPFTAWYAIGGGAEQRLDMIQSNTVCDNTLAAGTMRYDPLTSQVCARLSDDSSPASADYFRIPRERAWLVAQVNQVRDLTIRKNPSGGSFTVQRFRQNGIEAHSEDNTGWVIDGLDVGWMMDRCITMHNGPGIAGTIIRNNNVHHCGQEGIRLTGDTGACQILDNTVTDIQRSPLFEACFGVGTGCQQGFTDHGTAIRFLNFDGEGCRIAGNTIRDFGGGLRGRANGINLENHSANNIVENNYIQGGTNLTLGGRGILMSAGFASDNHNNNVIRNNRIYDVDQGFVVDLGGQFPGGAGTQNWFVNNTILNPRTHGIFADVNGVVDQQVVTHIINNLIVSTTSDDPSLVLVPAAQTSGWTTFENNAFECDSCSTDFDIVSYRGSGFERDGDCTVSVDCIADFGVSNVYGDTFVDATGPSPTMDITSGGSVAVDAGKTLALVSVDYLGTQRPQNSAFDIGAFESTFAALSPVITQAKYKFFGRNSPDSGHPLARENQDVRVRRHAGFSLRFALRGSVTTSDARLYALFARRCTPSCGSWAEVTADCTSSTGVCLIPHSMRADNTPISNALVLDGNTFNDNSVFVSGEGTYPALIIAPGEQAEIEYHLRGGNIAVIGDSVEMRIQQSNGVELDGYTVTPKLHVREGQSSGSVLGIIDN